MTDVTYLKNKQGLYVFKAMTQKADAVMRNFLDIPPPLSGQVFLHCDGTESGLRFTKNALEAEGLTVTEHGVEPPKKPVIDLARLTDF
jgi:hypothetical protein